MSSARNTISMLLLALIIPSYLSAAEINLKKLEGIKEIVEESIEQKKIPGAVVLVLNQGKIVYKQAFGNKSLFPSTEPEAVLLLSEAAELPIKPPVLSPPMTSP